MRIEGGRPVTTDNDTPQMSGEDARHDAVFEPEWRGGADDATWAGTEVHEGPNGLAQASWADGADHAELGAPPAMLETAATAASAAAILAAAFELGPALAHRVALAAREVALATLAGGMAVDVAIFDRRGTLLGHAAG